MIYTVTFNPAIDYLVYVPELMTAKGLDFSELSSCLWTEVPCPMRTNSSRPTKKRF